MLSTFSLHYPPRYPRFKVAILHDSATASGGAPKDEEDPRSSDEENESEEEIQAAKSKAGKSRR